MNRYKFLICTPPYATDSAGIIVLHELCDALIRNGYEAYLAFMQMTGGRWTFHSPASEQGFHPKLNRMSLDHVNYDQAINDALDNGICIYPEIVQGNPLMARRVVRYFLYFDGGITGVKCSHGEDDFILSWHAAYIQNPHFVLAKPVVDESMDDKDAPDFASRRLDLTFFGKGQNHARCHVIDGSIELPKFWPKTKVELACLLRNTRYLYTWDYYSSVNLDAILCGARPILMQTSQLENIGVGLTTSVADYWVTANKKGGGLGIDDPADYERQRRLYISDVKSRINEWPNQVRAAVQKMAIHFNI